MIDPVTFEILRHRFASLVEEGAIVLRNVSGSPSVAHSHDCNVALLTQQGDGVVIGPNIVSHALSCMHTVRYVAGEYADNPGIGEGDMFISNHPYISTPHQTCVVLVGPIHWHGQLVAWAGAGIHIADAGGPVPGQVSVGAQSIWEEAPPMPPLKLVEGGRIRRDIEEVYLIRSRTRLQNAIDMRAKIAATNAIKGRILELIERYEVEAIQEAMRQAIEFSEKRLRAILRQVPDGSWQDSSFLDYFDRGRAEIYVCKLKMRKEGEERGQTFGTVFVDGALAQGNGARRGKDGIDTGGGMDPAVGIPNVETNEFRYPILYLYRRQERDTGGPGTFRGGVGLGTGFIPHDVDGISITLHGHGTACPTASGLHGGFPGGVNQARIERNSEVLRLFRRGIVPVEIGESQGVLETPNPIGRSFLGARDIYHSTSCGGGGYGDPLDRSPDRVLCDVASGPVSAEWAGKIYGVIIRSSPPVVDRQATKERRQEIREMRRQQAAAPARVLEHPYPFPDISELPLLLKINDYLSVIQLLRKNYIRCRCGLMLCPADHNRDEYLAWREVSTDKIGPRHISAPDFVLRELYCPGCFVLVDVQVIYKGEPVGQEPEIKKRAG